MAVTALLGDYDTTTMLEVVRETNRVPTFLRERFIGGNLRPVGTRDVMLDFVGSNRAMAPIVSRQSGGVLVEKQPIMTGRYRPPKLAPLDIFNGEEAFERSAGEAAGGSKSAEERAQEYAAEQLLIHERMIVRRWEWMLAKLLSTGSVVLDGEGVRDTIDIGHTMEVTLSGEDLWTRATANILKNLRNWVDDVVEECDVAPDTCILGRDAADALMDDDSLMSKLDKANVNVGNIAPNALPSGAVRMGILEGLEIFRYPSFFRDDLTKASTPMIPANMAIIGCSSAIFPDQKMVFGAHYEVKEDKLYEETLIPRVWVDEAKNTRFLEVVSYPVPILPHVGSWLRATVI